MDTTWGFYFEGSSPEVVTIVTVSRMDRLERTSLCFTVRKMIALLLYVSLLCLPFYSSANGSVKINDRPIIGKFIIYSNINLS